MLLAIETSDILCSVAFWRHGKTLLEYNLELPMQHARLVGQLVNDGFALLGETLKDSSVTGGKVSLVACAVGPGSFTGLRIGLSFAQGFCLAGNLPIVGISNHQVLAAQSPEQKDELFTAIEARRNEVYVARLKRVSDLLTAIETHEVVAKDHLASYLPADSVLLIHHTLQLENVQRTDLREKGVRLYHKADFRAHWLAQIAGEKFKRRGADDLQTIEPMYIRSFAGVL